MFAHEKLKKANGEMKREAERNGNAVGKKGVIVKKVKMGRLVLGEV